MISRTISITIPEKLENDLQKQADKIGLSRSRFIGNLLLEWQVNQRKAVNECAHQNNNWCSHFDWMCNAPQTEAETCSEYQKSEG